MILYYIKLLIINKLILAFEFLIKKDNNLWLIGMDDGGGTKISGNAWHFAKYVQENHLDRIKIVCVSSCPSSIKFLKDNGFDVVIPNSIRAFIVALKSGVNLICGELHDEIPNFSKRGTFKVHLWHGVPLKKIYYLSPKMMERYNNRSRNMRILEAIRGVVHLEEYDAIIYTSEKLKDVMEKSFNNKKLFLTGQPRDDIFYTDISRDHLLKQLGLEDFSKKKIIVYLPTFRDSLDKSKNYKVFEKNAEANSLLSSNNAILFQKDHNTRVEKAIFEDNIIHLSDSYDTQKLMMVADVLITDYSSVYIDYLNMLRPMIFYCYDIESYMANDRGLNFDYHDDIVTPGPKVENEKKLLDTIQLYLENSDKDLSLRKESLNFYHKYQDGRNSQRVFEMICSEVKVEN